MKIPTLQGIIKRRILINYRAEPSVIQKILPERFRPKLQNDKAIVGICLIRLESIRPKNFPEFIGVSSENAAHRIAVEWKNENDETKEGVYVPRRDTDSFINSAIGGRLFPGEHHKAVFQISDDEKPNKIFDKIRRRNCFCQTCRKKKQEFSEKFRIRIAHRSVEFF